MGCFWKCCCGLHPTGVFFGGKLSWNQMMLNIPHLPGEGCWILSELFSSASCPPRPRPPPSPPLPPPPVSPRPCLHQLPPQLPPCQLFAKLFANFPAQCAPLDLNLGPCSVRTAGPQPGTCPAQCAPLDLNGRIECQKRCQIECQIECQKICQIKCHDICQIECQKICQIEC